MEHNIIWGQGDAAVVLGDWPGEYKVINNTIAFNMWDPKYSDRNYALLAAYPNDETGVSANMQINLAQYDICIQYKRGLRRIDGYLYG